MRFSKDKKGFSLIELLLAMAIFSVIMAAVYSVYMAILKHATIERKITKTELDVITAVWPFVKEVHTAGLGVFSSGNCTPAINFSEGVLTIHSTASGDSKEAGKWSHVGEDCEVNEISNGENVVVINAGNKEYMGKGSVEGGKVNPCKKDFYENASSIAYWVPPKILECYETKYSMRNYESGTRPVMCGPATQKVSRSVSNTGDSTSYQPMLDCVFGKDPQGDEGLNFRFGCISAAGDITWRADTNCGTSKLRAVRIGILIQSSPKLDIQAPVTVTFFEDIDPSLRVTINLSEEQRYYKWRKIEQTIPLRNLE